MWRRTESRGGEGGGRGGDIVVQMIDTMLKVEREKDGKIEKVEKAETWWQTNEMMVAKMHF